MHCFYVDSLGGERVSLGEEESAHCVRVLRLGEGAQVMLTDGAGTLAQGELVAVGKRAVEVAVAQRERLPRRPGQRTILAVAPTKNAERMEWLVEKVTEVGCGAVVPLLCERGVRVRINGARLERVAVSALKQSQGAYLPKIYPMVPLKAFLDQLAELESGMQDGGELGEGYIRAVAHCDEGERRDLGGMLRADAARPLVVLIGPEGDFTREEIAMAQGCGFAPVTLGAARLRTETAALVAAVLAGVRG